MSAEQEQRISIHAAIILAGMCAQGRHAMVDDSYVKRSVEIARKVIRAVDIQSGRSAYPANVRQVDE
jgi:hypothetical protein